MKAFDKALKGEPLKFANMTLFVSGEGKLVLHTKTYVDGQVRTGVNTREVAEYYLNYRERKMPRFMKLAEDEFRDAQQRFERAGKVVNFTSKQKSEILNKAAEAHAALYADACESSHDLRPEFCDAAKKLGKTLMVFARAGFETLTRHNSYDSETTIQSYRPRVA